MDVHAGLLVAARSLGDPGWLGAAHARGSSSLAAAATCWQMRAMFLLAVPEAVARIRARRARLLLWAQRRRPFLLALFAPPGRGVRAADSEAEEVPEAVD